jgi:methyl-accepting chemotaxis protein
MSLKSYKKGSKMSFLSNISIKVKMFLILLLPIVALLYQVSINTLEDYHHIQDDRLETEYIKLTVSITDLVHESQKERGMSAGFVGSKGVKFADALKTQREKTDIALSKLKAKATLLEQEKKTELEQRLERALKYYSSLATVRSQVDGLVTEKSKIIAFYTKSHALFLNVNAAMIKESDNPAVLKNSVIFLNFSLAKEQVGVQRAVGTGAFVAQAIPPAQKQKLVKLLTAEKKYMLMMYSIAPEHMEKEYDVLVKSATYKDVDAKMNILLNAWKPKDFQGVKAGDFFQLMTQKIKLIKGFEKTIIANMMDEIDKEDKAASHELTMLLVENIVIIFIVLLLGMLITKEILRTIKNLQGYMLELSQTKNLTKRCSVTSKDELGDVVVSLNSLIDVLNALINDAKNSSTENASIAHELSTTALSVGNNVEESVVLVEEATRKSEAIKEKIMVAVGEAQNSKEDVLKANDNLGEARNEVITLTRKVQESADKENELAQRMDTLASDTTQVKEVLVVISDIADQTNLLALNAAIEAARAGEHGRGFAVVADEVRKLAERTQKSLTEINATINVIVQSVTDASGTMSQNAEDIQKLSDISEEVEAKINATVEIVGVAVSVTEATVNDFNQTSEDVDEIVSSVTEINKISSLNARNVEEIAAAAEHLNTMTDNLHTQLETFESN